MNQEKLDPSRPVAIPMRMHPLFRTQIAIDNGLERRLLFKTWGGLGDQICAEPTLRYALNNFKDCEISLASEQPGLFSHLDFKRVFDLREERPVEDKYLVFETITPPDDSNMVWLFFSHMLTNCVDFPSLCALRSQLPVADREVRLNPSEPKEAFLGQKQVWLHAGKHWPSKTFPKDWWNSVINRIIEKGYKPVLVGADTDDNRGTVDVEASGCLDLRNKLSINDSIWHLQRCGVLLTNDSSPLHMAASHRFAEGEPYRSITEIGYVATCKHPDFITHWRNGQWGHLMRNFGRGGIWDVIDHCPNKGEKITVDQVEEDLLRSWLPDPHGFADWGCQKADA